MARRIATYLANDHGRLLSLFREFQETDPSEIEKQRKRFKRFYQGMDRHGRWVGSTLASRMEDRVSEEKQEKLKQFLGGEPEQIEEHISAIREKLSKGDPDTSSIEQQLLSKLQDHFSKEEQVLYPLFDEFLEDEERSEILDQFDEELAQMDDV